MIEGAGAHQGDVGTNLLGGSSREVSYIERMVEGAGSLFGEAEQQTLAHVAELNEHYARRVAEDVLETVDDEVRQQQQDGIEDHHRCDGW